jgi:hypothetical protein
MTARLPWAMRGLVFSALCVGESGSRRDNDRHVGLTGSIDF